MAQVPFTDRDEKLLTIDSDGSGLIMQQDKLLGVYQPRTCLIPGTLTRAQRLARTDLLAIENARIKESDSGLMYEVVGGAWQPHTTKVWTSGSQAPASGAGIAVPWLATGWAAAMNAAITQLAAAGGGTIIVPRDTRPYVADQEILLSAVSNVTIDHAAGVTVTRPDPVTLTCTTTSGSTAATIVSGDASSLRTDFYHAQYVTGTGIQRACRVGNVSGSNLTLSANATASGTVTLTFHPAHNIYRRNNCSNVHIRAPWGRATLDGNGAASPISGDSADALRNCIRTEFCTDVSTVGLKLRNAHYHGEIAVGISGVIRYYDILTELNGFRGVHAHGDDPTSVISDLFVDRILSNGDGIKAWMLQDPSTTGLFFSFSNSVRQQIGSITVRNAYGNGVQMTGRSGSGAGEDVRQVQYSQIVVEDCGIGVTVAHGLRGAQIGRISARGRLIQVANATLGTGTTTMPMLDNVGAPLAGAVMQSIVLPGGTDMTQFRAGHGLYLQDAAGMLDVALAVWSVDAPSRTLWVFRDGSPTTRPWAGGSDGITTLASVWTMRGAALYLVGSVATTRPLEIAHIESLHAEACRRVIFTDVVGSGVRTITGLSIGTVKHRDCYFGGELQGVDGGRIGSWIAKDTGNRRTGNDTGGISLRFKECNGIVVGHFDGRGTGVGAMTRNGCEELDIAATCNNIKVMAIVAQNQNSSQFAVQAGGTNIQLGDPRLADGTTLAPFTTGGTNVSVFRYGLT